MEVSIRSREAVKGFTTHIEIRPNSFLSNLACTIPLPDFNQSPRSVHFLVQGWGAGLGAGAVFFGPLEPEPLKKNTRSRSRLGKKSGAGTT